MSAIDEMIEKHLKPRGVVDPRVLKALREVPRERFLPDDLKDSAYDDRALGINHGQTISQPYIVAWMSQLLQIDPGDRVLEIGTGSGYQAAILSKLAKEVYSVERIKELFHDSTKLLQELGYSNISTAFADGTLGWPDQAPFDKIIITAASEAMPTQLIDQLKDCGRLVAPIGPRSSQKIILGTKEKGFFRTTEGIAVRFVPLVEGEA